MAEGAMKANFMPLNASQQKAQWAAQSTSTGLIFGAEAAIERRCERTESISRTAFEIATPLENHPRLHKDKGSLLPSLIGNYCG
jgi:hypothetical protein